jgi:hypothetical protein
MLPCKELVGNPRWLPLSCQQLAVRTAAKRSFPRTFQDPDYLHHTNSSVVCPKYIAIFELLIHSNTLQWLTFPLLRMRMICANPQVRQRRCLRWRWLPTLWLLLPHSGPAVLTLSM